MNRPIVAALILLTAAGCSGPTAPGDQPPLLEALPRTLSTGESAAIAATNRFAFDLLGRIVADRPAENAFVSPLSVSLALGMVMNGARGETRDSMAATLGFGSLPQHAINEAYRTLIGLLAGLDDRVEFTIANSIWTSATYPVSPAFLEDARTYFDAEARSLDFGDPATPGVINGWVSSRTGGRIPSIVEPPIDPQSVLFAVNAIYFKGLWRDQFPKGSTADGTFTTAAGAVQTVPFMHRKTETPFRQGPDYVAADLYYGAGAHTMTVIVPTGTTTADELATRLDAAGFAAIVGGMAPLSIDVWLPRFRLEYKRSLKEDLVALGMGIAFDDRRADLTGIGPAGPFISQVQHRTFVDVNEEGTEAAAATSVDIGVTSLPPSLRADRPFLLAIRERLSGTILFLGRINAIPAA